MCYHGGLISQERYSDTFAKGEKIRVAGFKIAEQTKNLLRRPVLSEIIYLRTCSKLNRKKQSQRIVQEKVQQVSSCT